MRFDNFKKVIAETPSHIKQEVKDWMDKLDLINSLIPKKGEVFGLISSTEKQRELFFRILKEEAKYNVRENFIGIKDARRLRYWEVDKVIELVGLEPITYKMSYIDAIAFNNELNRIERHGIIIRVNLNDII